MYESIVETESEIEEVESIRISCLEGNSKGSDIPVKFLRAPIRA